MRAFVVGGSVWFGAATDRALLRDGREIAAREFAPQVQGNLVAPGAIDMTVLSGDSMPERGAREAQIPVGREGPPEEGAEALALLLSGRSSYITGATIDANGGTLFG